MARKQHITLLIKMAPSAPSNMTKTSELRADFFQNESSFPSDKHLKKSLLCGALLKIHFLAVDHLSWAEKVTDYQGVMLKLWGADSLMIIPNDFAFFLQLR